mmetsp:Transcript_37560/g.83959  ORF Transcript_37560/g.83959 Transcript_37560/m.83959 type:complete len:459 (-) Transcript_37560:189-1565(-)
MRRQSHRWVLFACSFAATSPSRGSPCGELLTPFNSVPVEGGYCHKCVPKKSGPLMCAPETLTDGFACHKKCMPPLCTCRDPADACTCACNDTQDLGLRAGPPMTADISFLGKVFSHSSWVELKETIDCRAQHGTWTKEPTPTTNRIERSFPAQSPCGMWFHGHPCSQVFNGSTLDYSWQVSHSKCQHPVLRPFDRAAFCRIIRSGTDGGALFVGDSLSLAFEFSLKNALLQEAYNSSAEYATARGCDMSNKKVRAAVKLCPKAADGWELWVGSVRADRNLLLYTEEELYIKIKDDKSNFEESPGFTAIFLEKSPSLLVMNRGAHYEPTPKVLRDLNRTLSFIFCESPGTSVVFRATVPGHFHPDTDFFKEPLETIPATWNKYERAFNYHQMMDQNREVQRFLAAAFPQVIFLDVATSTILRRDGHRDYLHYCVPGPMDHWVTLLYNALVLVDEAPTHR